MTDIELLNKLAEFKKEDLGDDTILGYSDKGKIIRVKDVEKLDLFGTDLKEITENIGCLCNLTVLDLSNTKLRELPESIGNLSSLKELYMNEMPLRSLPESIGNLSSLQCLYISWTQLRSLPESIGNLSSLQKLSIMGAQLRSLPESIGNLSSLQRLNISGAQLRSLPESIGNLSSLKRLVMNEAQLRSLPESIGNLLSLQRLDMNGAQLRSLPESIGNLSSLQRLNMNGAQLINLPESIGNLSSLQRMDMSEAHISSLPGSIGNLTSLQHLDMSRTQISSLPESIGNLSSLQELDMSWTQISSLPESIGNLSSLRELDMSRTQINSLSESIGSLSSLLNLDMRGTKLRSLPKNIGSLSSLQRLSLNGTQISSLPESIGGLSSLQVLYMSDTQISSLPESIGNLSSLQSLDISGTQISKLPESIGGLSSLHSLDMRETQIRSLPESICSLSSLLTLDMRGTKLRSLPKNIGSLSSLQSLDMSETKLSSLPNSIGDLSSLQYLNICGTQVSILPESYKNMRNLTCLDIRGTKIVSIDKGLMNLPIRTLVLEKLHLDRIPQWFLDYHMDFKTVKIDEDRRSLYLSDGIYINGLSLSKQPVSLFYQNRELIEKYYVEEKISVNSAKVIFLGDGKVGKTYTLKRLLKEGKKATDQNTYPTQTTHGVLIKPYHFTDHGDQYNVKLWDFGGQQIMHSMHRCFLTERSCYVVMISTRTDRDLMEQAKYWLRTVNSFATDAPVIVLVNQWTKNLIGVDEYQLKKEFKNIKEFLYFSVVEAEDEEFLSLKNAIVEQVRQLDCYGMEFPRSWYQLMTDLENETSFYISKSSYYQMCFEHGLRYKDNSQEGIYEWLLDWFNDLGVCFSYHKNSKSQILDQYELLNPQWLTRAAYVLINNGKQESDNGILTRKQIETILTKTEPLDFDDLGVVSFEPIQVEYILEILRKVQITYQLPGGRELVPVLCDENSAGSAQPEWFDNETMQHTSYEFHYEYLPDTIIHRLMIFCYQSHYYVRFRWRKGMRVDFTSDDSARLTAVIDTGNENQSVMIDIYSDGHIPCWQFLSKLREEILQINTDLNLTAKDYINMETDGVKDRFSVEKVLRSRSRGWDIIQADYYDGDYKVSHLYGSISYL